MPGFTMQTPERKPPVGVVFDSSIEDSIDQVLALAMVLVYDSKREARLSSLSVSRNNLKLAAFCELMGRFYSGEQPGEPATSRTAVAIGMSEAGTTGTTVQPMVASVLGRTASNGKPLYPRSLDKLNDTADPVALIRNALSAQQDQNAAVILAGPPVNLIGLLALPGSRQLIQKKARSLVIASPFEDVAGFSKLLAEWPGPVVSAGDINESVGFPGNSIEQDFTWATNHPVVDAYRSARGMPYDAPASALAAVLHAVHPDTNHFKLSEPGVMTVLSGGRTQFSPNPQGRHRQLIITPEQKDGVVQIFRQIVSSKPPEPRRPGPRGGQP